VEPKGYVFNTEAFVGEAVLKGRFLGKLSVERTLTLYSSAQVKGTITAGRLIIPAQNALSWNESWKVAAAEIEGELVGHLHASAGVVLKATARFFGKISAAALQMEEGAMFVGAASIRAGSE
jgi:cytoskeletal protein CcmA (bactofilin family)